MPKPTFRKTRSVPGLLKEVRACFDGIEEAIASRGLNLTDCLPSGLSVFGLKYPSLLPFDPGRGDERVRSNLNTLYGIKRVPLRIRRCAND